MAVTKVAGTVIELADEIWEVIEATIKALDGVPGAKYREFTLCMASSEFSEDELDDVWNLLFSRWTDDLRIMLVEKLCQGRLSVRSYEVYARVVLR